MSNTYSSIPPTGEYTSGTGGPSGPDEASGTADVAKEQASHVAGAAADAGGRVVDSAKEEGAKVASEAKTQVADLFAQSRDQLVEQAGEQQQRVAGGLHSLSDELSGMARNAQGGVAGDLVQQAASRAGSIADWLGERDPGSLVDEVRRFAREKPGTFIAIAAGAGLLVGRLTRSAAGAAKDEGADSPGSEVPAAPAVPATPAYSGPAASAYAEPAYPDSRYPGDTTVDQSRL